MPINPSLVLTPPVDASIIFYTPSSTGSRDIKYKCLPKEGSVNDGDRTYTFKSVHSNEYNFGTDVDQAAKKSLRDKYTDLSEVTPDICSTILTEEAEKRTGTDVKRNPFAKYGVVRENWTIRQSIAE
jgi:hypothetical protein